MSVDILLLVLASFLASSVEFVEAFTIVLAVGLTHGWRTALIGASSASLVLFVVVAALGPSLLAIPIAVLQVFVGLLLLIFGMQWLRKAVLRRAGLKALHNEDQAFQEDLREFAQEAATTGLVDWTGFTLSFKGVFLEGLEVAFIVLTFGANSGESRGLLAAAMGALAAFVLVGIAGVVVRQPLSRVPENDLKFMVGTLLTAFGTFWIGEGAGVEWALSDFMIVVLAVAYAGLALALASRLASRMPARPAATLPEAAR